MTQSQGLGDILGLSAAQLVKKYLGKSEKNGTKSPASEREASDSLLGEEAVTRLMNSRRGAIELNAPSLYSHYRSLYSRDAASAAENAFGLAVAKTGGYANTNASALANRAYEAYMEKLYDRYEQASQKEQTQSLSLAKTAAGYGDYSLLEQLGANMSEARRERELNKALRAAEYGDYSALAALGVDTSLLMYGDLLEYAREISRYGDFSALEALGVDTQTAENEKLLEKAVTLAKYGDYSLLGEFSDKLSQIKSKISVTVQRGAEAAFARGGYEALSDYLERQIGYGQLTESEKKQIIKTLTGK